MSETYTSHHTLQVTWQLDRYSMCVCFRHGSYPQVTWHLGMDAMMCMSQTYICPPIIVICIIFNEYWMKCNNCFFPEEVYIDVTSVNDFWFFQRAGYIAMATLYAMMCMSQTYLCIPVWSYIAHWKCDPCIIWSEGGVPTLVDFFNTLASPGASHNLRFDMAQISLLFV